MSTRLVNCEFLVAYTFPSVSSSSSSSTRTVTSLLDICYEYERCCLWFEQIKDSKMEGEFLLFECFDDYGLRFGRIRTPRVAVDSIPAIKPIVWPNIVVMAGKDKNGSQAPKKLDLKVWTCPCPGKSSVRFAANCQEPRVRLSRCLKCKAVQLCKMCQNGKTYVCFNCNR